MNHLIGEYLFNRPDEIYHVTVMPCYDKKLEAARDDFVFQLDSQEEIYRDEGLQIPEVDSVLTTGEVLDLIQVRWGFLSSNLYNHFHCKQLLCGSKQ